MTAVLLTVGDEILLGQIVNTNAAWLGERLALAGLDVRRSETVGDEPGAIRASMERAYADGARVVVVTGGLGPTHDDVTRAVAADVFGRSLDLRPELLAEIEARFAARGRPMPDANRVQAEVPDGFDVLPNAKGTAPGLWGERQRGGQAQAIALMPGVPHEMQAMFETGVLPRLRALRPGVVAHRTLLTAGRGETDLAEQLAELASDRPAGLDLAYLPSAGTVRLRLTAKGDDAEAARTLLDEAVAAFRDRLGDLVVGEGRATLEGAVLDRLVEEGLTLAAAESCTGGALAARLTARSGASRAFHGGVVAYDNVAKVALLGVRQDTLDAHGAVSEPVALQMARGARDAFGVDLGVSTTGIAGPTGGTPEKPVGTVWIAYADRVAERAVLLRLGTDRGYNIERTTTAALDLVRRQRLRQARS